MNEPAELFSVVEVQVQVISEVVSIIVVLVSCILNGQKWRFLYRIDSWTQHKHFLTRLTSMSRDMGMQLMITWILNSQIFYYQFVQDHNAM